MISGKQGLRFAPTITAGPYMVLHLGKHCIRADSARVGIYTQFECADCTSCALAMHRPFKSLILMGVDKLPPPPLSSSCLEICTRTQRQGNVT